MADPLVDIHVPLTPSDVPEGDYAFPWIDSVMDFLFELEDSRGESDDDGEELFVHPAPETHLIALAREVASLPGVPAGDTRP